jgi:hypothetical protein
VRRILVSVWRRILVSVWRRILVSVWRRILVSVWRILVCCYAVYYVEETREMSVRPCVCE